MEGFKLPDRDTRLIKHDNTVYKIKLVYVTSKRGSHEHILPCDAKSMQHEIEEAISVVLSGNLTPVKTDHFIIHTENSRWLQTHASMLTLFVKARQDVEAQPTQRQPKSPQTESKRQTEQARRMGHLSSSASTGGTHRRKHTRTFEVKETRSPSPPQPKKMKPSDTRSQDQSLEQQDVQHRAYLLRRRDRVPDTNERQQHTIKNYHLRSQGTVSGALDQQGSEGSECRPRRQRGSSRGSLARVTGQAKQEHVRDISHPHEAEPRVGATANVPSRPAYPQGGAVQHDTHHVLQPAQHDGAQYQLEEQRRLQRLVGNQQTHQTEVAQYQLQSRGPLQRMVSAVLTPVKNLFS